MAILKTIIIASLIGAAGGLSMCHSHPPLRRSHHIFTQHKTERVERSSPSITPEATPTTIPELTPEIITPSPKPKLESF